LSSDWNGCIQYLAATFDVEQIPGSNMTRPHHETWIARAGIEDETPYIKWSWSFYHAMTQLLAISVGVVPPQRVAEIWTYLISITLGASLYAFFVASLTSVFSEAGASGKLYRAKMEQLDQFIRHHKFPADMRMKLHAFYEISHPGRQMFSGDEIISGLSHSLRGQVALLQCKPVLEMLQVLHDERLSAAIASNLERLVFVDGDYVIYEGEESRGMYFINDGAVEVLAPKLKPDDQTGGSGAQNHTTFNPCAVSQDGPAIDEVVVTTLGPTAFFGEMALLNTEGHTSVTSVRVTGFLDSYHLSAEAYNHLLAMWPNFRSYIEMVAKLRAAALTTANAEALFEESSDATANSSPVKRHGEHYADDSRSLVDLFSILKGKATQDKIGDLNPHAREMLEIRSKHHRKVSIHGNVEVPASVRAMRRLSRWVPSNVGQTMSTFRACHTNRQRAGSRSGEHPQPRKSRAGRAYSAEERVISASLRATPAAGCVGKQVV
jgi:CRP-like cAMP-binding protein